MFNRGNLLNDPDGTKPPSGTFNFFDAPDGNAGIDAGLRVAPLAGYAGTDMQGLPASYGDFSSWSHQLEVSEGGDFFNFGRGVGLYTKEPINNTSFGCDNCERENSITHDFSYQHTITSILCVDSLP